jgi:ribonucleoside-diphosphate reductase alpha chain
MSIDKLTTLKSAGEAPSWMLEPGYNTLANGYLLQGETPRGMYTRVSKAAASYYPNSAMWEKKFFDAMWNNWLCLSSPVCSNMGTNRGLPISCNALHIDDNLDSIFMKNYELAILSKNGAGVAAYLGDIRGRGAPIKGNGKSEGIVPWCKILDTTTVSVNQGCYDDNTELLTENGWEKFSELQAGTKVAQSTDKGEVSFVDFTDYIAYEVDEELVHLHNRTSIDLLLTKNHRVAVEYHKRISNRIDRDGKFLDNRKEREGYLRVIEADKLHLHRDNRFWCAAREASGKLEHLTPLDRFHIAYQADGSTNPSASSNGTISGSVIYTFHFSKERKIVRLRDMLNELGWKYTESMSSVDDTTTFLVRVPLSIHISKRFNETYDLKDMSASFAREFVEELGHWDGSFVKLDTVDNSSISYLSTIESNTDFVQAVAFIAGKMSNRGAPTRNKEHHQWKYPIYICDRDSVGGEETEKSEVHYKGMVYCVSVPTGLLVVRRNGFPVICGNSTRRGATALYIPIDHLDINEFISIRRPTGDVNRRCLNINHGICIPDDWMQSMIAGDKHKRELWTEILKARVETGEPYLFFSDNVNKNNPDCYKQNGLTVKTSNLCSEITLYTDPDHTFVCCLSSLNLVRYDEWKDTDLPNIAVRFLDAVLSEYIEKTEHIKGMEASRASAIKGRAIGIGVLGWHTLLQERGLPFDSFDTMQLNAEIFRNIRVKADEETAILAKELGEPEWCKGFGRRNTHTCAIAPTVSNSTISGGHSAGIEPIAANVFVQKSAKGTFIIKNPTLTRLLQTKEKDTPEIWSSINEQSGSVQHLPFLSKEEKEVFLTAREINQHTIVKLAVQRQRWIDQAQSVNLFFASNSSPKYIHDVHLSAWKAGLKTLYYLRSDGVIKSDLASRSESDCKACEA